MLDFNTIALGFILLFIGIALFVLIRVLLRTLPSPSLSTREPPSPPMLSIRNGNNRDALFVVKPGGRVIYTNQTAREWFSIPHDEQPNLEHLARRARPKDVFLNLCAAEGQAQFSLSGIFLEGTSYVLPYPDQHVIAVTLRRPQLTSLTRSGTDLPRGEIDIFSKLSQEMTASLNLETTLKSVLENVDHLVPSDFSEITLWDHAHKSLIPYRFVSLSGVDRQLETTTERYQLNDGFSGYLISKQTPLLIDDVDQFQEVQPAIDRQRFPIKSFLGIPLLIAGEPTGTLELASLRTHAFTQNDLEILKILSGQAAVAIHNARIHEQEQERVAELSGLATLAQATSALGDPEGLYDRLIASISPLLDVEILGLLIYDESQRIIEGKIPFIGVPDQFVDLYQIPIHANSPAERVWSSNATIVTDDAREDERLIDLGLAHLAQAASIKNTALVPLPASGRIIGYLQAANKRDGTSLTDDDLRLLAIIAGQIGPIIENATLVQDSRRRARQAEAMRRITSLAGSGATLDEILKYSILELARLLNAEVAGLFLLDPNQGELHLHKSSLFGVPTELAESFERLSINDPNFRQTVTGSLQPFISDDVGVDERVLSIYRPLTEAMGSIRSVIDVPLEVRENGIGEIILGSHREALFGPRDAQIASTAARQLASAIERSSLYTQTDENLRREIDHLTSLNRIHRELNTTLDISHMLDFLQQECLHISQANICTIRLLDPSTTGPQRKTISFTAGTSERTALSDAEQLVIDSGESIQISDYAESPYDPPDVEIVSSLIAPVKNQGETIGIIHICSTDPDRFNPSVKQAIEGIALHAGSAIYNAILYQNLNQQTDQLTKERNGLNSLLQIPGPEQGVKTLKQRFEIIAHSIQASSPFELVLICEYEPTQEALQVVTGVGISAESLLSQLSEDIPWKAITPLLDPEFRVSDSYFIPAELRPYLDFETPFFPEVSLIADLSENSWQRGDLLLTPLLNASGNPLGLIRFDRPRDGLRPDSEAIEALEIFTAQSAVHIETFRKIEELEERITDLQIESARAVQAQELAIGNLPKLLHKDLEQTITIRRLNQRAQRIRAGLDIAEIVNLQPDRSAVLWALGQEMLTRMNLDIALIADSSPGGPRLLHSLGSISADTNTEALLGQRNPLRLSLQTGETLLIPNLEEDENWKNAPLLQAIDAKGVICMPIAANGKTDAAVLAISQEPLPPFNEEDKQIYSLLASQVSITLQNLNLLTETRRRLREVGLLLEFSRQLGSLDPDEILRTLINSTLRVISNAHAGIVSIWDERQSKLIPKAASGYTDNQLITEITYRDGEALPGLTYSSGQPMRVDEVNFAEHYKLPSENLLRYREATGGRVPVSSLLVPLQAGELTLGVLVLDNFNTPGAFTEDDEALITSLTQQTALAMENARLFQASEQRTQQLRSLTDMAATITSSLQIDELIGSLIDHLSSVLPHNTATLWIREGNQLTIRAARGFEDPQQQVGLTVSVEDSQLLSEMVASGQPINVENVHADARFPALIEHPHLSWLGIPLITKGDVAGVIALEKTEPSFYTHEHVQIATTLAGQTAVALENARLFEDSLRRTQDLDQRSQRLNLLNRISTTLSETLDPDEILHFTIQELRQALRGSTVSLLIFDESGIPILQGETPSQETDYPHSLPEIPLFDYLKQTLGMYTTEDITNKEEFNPWKPFFEKRKTRALLALPLATGNDLHGLVFIHSTRPVRFPPGEVDLARTITNQAAIAFQNARLFEKTMQMTEELERRVADRTRELEEEHQRTQILLNIITELSASLDLDIVVNRTLALINEISGAEQSTVLLIKPEESTFLFLASHGYTVPPTEGGQQTWLNVDEGLAGWVLSEQKAALINDLTEDERWVENEERPSNHRSALAVPLLVGPEALGVLMLFHRQPGRFSPDQLDLIQATAKQIAVAINNAQLYLLIRDQAERLGSMLRTQQIEASRSRAILESVADGVLVTDINDFITLFNASAEEITGLKGDQVVGKSLDDFIGLFGGAAQTWMQTIHTWSDDPSTYSFGETFAEQIELEDGRVVAVSLAPVILRDELLGTVSIFRDITHQVEVDRLKSEFVATVSHELRTPMTSIKGYVEVLLLGAAGELNEQQSEFLQTVQSNTERLNILVNDLLDVSRIEAGKTTISSQPLAVDKLAEEVITSLISRSRNEGKPMNIQLNSPSELPPVIGDKELVSQILSKLTDNAYNYTPNNGCITVSMKIHEDELQVDVQDTGIGIAKSDQERVFDRFYRGEDPMVLATAGTGLGLSIVKQLVEMHNGRLWMESSGVPGKGCTFSFTLPVYQIDSEV